MRTHVCMRVRVRVGVHVRVRVRIRSKFAHACMRGCGNLINTYTLQPSNLQHKQATCT